MKACRRVHIRVARHARDDDVFAVFCGNRVILEYYRNYSETDCNIAFTDWRARSECLNKLHELEAKPYRVEEYSISELTAKFGISHRDRKTLMQLLLMKLTEYVNELYPD